MYYALMFLLWLGCTFSRGLFKEPFLKEFFAIGQGVIIGHVITVLWW